jgi:hypothetical protein
VPRHALYADCFAVRPFSACQVVSAVFGPFVDKSVDTNLVRRHMTMTVAKWSRPRKSSGSQGRRLLEESADCGSTRPPVTSRSPSTRKRWLCDWANLRRRMRDFYRGLWRLHILPALGETAIGQPSPAHVRTWRVATITAGRRRAPTVAKSYRLLHAICAAAAAAFTMDAYRHASEADLTAAADSVTDYRLRTLRRRPVANLGRARGTTSKE